MTCRTRSRTLRKCNLSCALCESLYGCPSRGVFTSITQRKRPDNSDSVLRSTTSRISITSSSRSISWLILLGRPKRTPSLCCHKFALSACPGLLGASTVSENERRLLILNSPSLLSLLRPRPFLDLVSAESGFSPCQLLAYTPRFSRNYR